LCGKEFDENQLDELEEHFSSEHGINDDSEVWSNVVIDYKTTGLKVEWECGLCGNKFDSYNAVLSHLVDDHNIPMNDERILSQYVKPIVSVDGFTGEYYDDGSMYWWPLFEIVEELIDNELENDEYFRQHSKCSDNSEVYTSHVGVNVTKRIINGSPRFELVFFIVPICEFDATSFIKFINAVFSAIEKVTGVKRDGFSVYFNTFEGARGSMFTSTPQAVLNVAIPLNQVIE